MKKSDRKRLEMELSDAIESLPGPKDMDELFPCPVSVHVKAIIRIANEALGLPFAK